MSFTILSIYKSFANGPEQANAAEQQNENVNYEKGTLITDIAISILLIVAAVVLIILEKMGIHTGMIGTIVSASAGGVGLAFCIADQITLMVLHIRRPLQQLQQEENNSDSNEIIKANDLLKKEQEQQVETIKQLKLEIENHKKQNIDNATVQKEQLDQANQSILTLNQTNDQLKQEKDSQVTTINQLNIETENLKTQNIDNANAQKVQLDQANLSNWILEQEKGLLKLDKDCQLITIIQLQSEITNLKLQNTDSSNTLKPQLDQATQSIESLNTTNGQLKQEIASQATTINQLTSELENFRKNEQEQHELAQIYEREKQNRAAEVAERKWEADSRLVNMPTLSRPELKKLEAGEALCIRQQSNLQDRAAKIFKYTVYHFNGRHFLAYKNISSTRVQNKEQDPLLKTMKIHMRSKK